MPQISGLENWILPEYYSAETLAIQVAIGFSNDIDSLRLIDSPKQRLKQSGSNRKAALLTFTRQFAIKDFEIIEVNYSLKFDSTLALVEQMRDVPGVEQINILEVYSAQKKENPPTTKYFCLKVLFVVQIEGYTKGLQLTDEQFIVVKAASFEDAQQKLNPFIKAYEKPYMNSDGEWVRWKFNQILDYNEISFIADRYFETECIEVFSQFKRRRMKSEDFWDGKW